MSDMPEEARHGRYREKHRANRPLTDSELQNRTSGQQRNHRRGRDCDSCGRWYELTTKQKKNICPYCGHEHSK